jgi:CDP-diacylglycerol--serine O-phosphatidyltransferase
MIFGRVDFDRMITFDAGKLGMKKQLPNLLTLMNLLSGSMAIVFLFQGKVEWTAALVIIAAFFDVLDGMIARMLKVSGPMGKELDSLADMVSFGLLPGLVMYDLFLRSDWENWIGRTEYFQVVRFFPLLITAFSALRLAKFNIDDRQHNTFIGLPTPANTLWIISLPMILVNMPGQFDFLILNAPVLLMLTVLSCYLMVAEIPLLSFKMSGFSVDRYGFQYLLIVFSLAAVLIFSFAGIPIVVAFYVFLSLLKNYKHKLIK